MDSVSDRALTCGAELVVHAYRDGRAPGLERLEELGVPSVVFPATGTSEDVAMLLADDKGAELIVAVGTHATLVEFLDKGRSGMASTFLTRLRVGRQARRRQGREPALPQPHLQRPARAAGRGRTLRAGGRDGRARGRSGRHHRAPGTVGRLLLLASGALLT